jgi:hypothetical protein
MTYSVTQFWASSSIGLKFALGVVLLVIILVTFGTTRSCVSAYKDRKADEAIAEERAKSEEHRKKADEAEAKAKEDEAKRALAEMAVQAAGAKAEAIAEKVQIEDAKLTEELQRVGDSIEPCERVRRVCARLRINPADCSCTSN